MLTEYNHGWVGLERDMLKLMLVKVELFVNKWKWKARDFRGSL